MMNFCSNNLKPSKTFKFPEPDYKRSVVFLRRKKSDLLEWKYAFIITAFYFIYIYENVTMFLPFLLPKEPK